MPKRVPSLVWYWQPRGLSWKLFSSANGSWWPPSLLGFGEPRTGWIPQMWGMGQYQSALLYEHHFIVPYMFMYVRIFSQSWFCHILPIPNLGMGILWYSRLWSLRIGWRFPGLLLAIEQKVTAVFRCVYNKDIDLWKWLNIWEYLPIFSETGTTRDSWICSGRCSFVNAWQFLSRTWPHCWKLIGWPAVTEMGKPAVMFDGWGCTRLLLPRGDCLTYDQVIPRYMCGYTKAWNCRTSQKETTWCLLCTTYAMFQLICACFPEKQSFLSVIGVWVLIFMVRKKYSGSKLKTSRTTAVGRCFSPEPYWIIYTDT